MTSTPGGGSRPLSDVDGDRVDTIFDVAAHAHRRFLLGRLGDGGGPLTVREAAADIATRESTEASPVGADAVATGLHHVHLPKLVDANIVEYDSDAGTIALGARGDEVVRFVERTL